MYTVQQYYYPWNCEQPATREQVSGNTAQWVVTLRAMASWNVSMATVFSSHCNTTSTGLSMNSTPYNMYSTRYEQYTIQNVQY